MLLNVVVALDCSGHLLLNALLRWYVTGVIINPCYFSWMINGLEILAYVRAEGDKRKKEFSTY